MDAQTFTDASVRFSRLMLPFPLLEGIALRLNSNAHRSNGYISGNLMVDMNPEKNVSNVVLLATARYSNFQLIKASSVCFTQFSNTTEIMIHVRIAFLVDTITKGD